MEFRCEKHLYHYVLAHEIRKKGIYMETKKKAEALFFIGFSLENRRMAL